MRTLKLISASLRGYRAAISLVLALGLITTTTSASDVALADNNEGDKELLASQECVVLLHGLARSHRSMSPLKESLRGQGYHVVNSDYNSLDAPIEELAPRAIDHAIAACPANYETVHFVTHSLGGILVRQYAQHTNSAVIGRVVMLGPPNKGSELVDRFVKIPGFNALNGFAGKQLGTNTDSKPNTLAEAKFELGIIAGSKSMNPILSLLLPGQDDGKVTIERTKLEGMKEHLIVPTTHTFMMRNPQVIAQVSHFLREGEFDQGI